MLVGLGIGLAVGTKDPDPNEVAASIRATLAAAGGSIEVAAIEYEEAVVDGAVEREAEYEGSLAALSSSNSRYQEVRDPLASLAPAVAEEIDSSYTRCRDLMERKVEVERVSECLGELELMLVGA